MLNVDYSKMITTVSDSISRMSMKDAEAFSNTMATAFEKASNLPKPNICLKDKVGLAVTGGLIAYAIFKKATSGFETKFIPPWLDALLHFESNIPHMSQEYYEKINDENSQEFKDLMYGKPRKPDKSTQPTNNDPQSNDNSNRTTDSSSEVDRSGDVNSQDQR